MTEDRDVEVTHDISTFAAELRRLADALENGEAYTIEVDGRRSDHPRRCTAFRGA